MGKNYKIIEVKQSVFAGSDADAGASSEKTAVKTVQIHTEGRCHPDADMTSLSNSCSY